MGIRHTELFPLGWNDWLEGRASCEPGDTLARVAAVDREWLLLMDPSGTFRAKLAGRYLYRHKVSRERPCVGDWACVERGPGDDLGRVRALLERRTVLRRRAAGGSGESQWIAANVDTVVIENEPGCAVREAVQTGALSPEEYGHFIQLREEPDFYAMSRAEKRQKDRDFGRFLKSAKKDMGRG